MSSANVPAVRTRGAAVTRPTGVVRELRLGPVGQAVLVATVAAFPLAGIAVGLLP